MSTLTDKLPTLDLDEAKKPLFAAVGVVDLYVGQAKEIPAEAKKLQTKVTEKVTARVDSARTVRTEQVKALPAQVKGLPAKASEKATGLRTGLQGRVSRAQASATEYYGTLAARGEKLVSQIRRQQTTTSAIAEGKAAVKKAEAAATSARKATTKAAKAVGAAVEKVG